MAELVDKLQGKFEDPTSAINSASLIRQGKRIGAKGSARFAAKALRGSAKLALRTAGTIFGTPAYIAQIYLTLRRQVQINLVVL